jgi:putative tryptophan/tyrosine transport system substrate-binding protein
MSLLVQYHRAKSWPSLLIRRLAQSLGPNFRCWGLGIAGGEYCNATANLDGALSAMMRERPDGLMVTADAVHQLHVGRIINFLANNRQPGLFQLRENVVAGGLMAYGPSLPDMFWRAARYVHRILQGTRPADLPVEQPTKFELVINLKTATALGLTISNQMQLLADEVIE